MLLCDVVMPCKLVTGPNSRMYYMKRARINKQQAWTLAMLIQAALPSDFKSNAMQQYAVTFTRIAPARGRWQMDSDNLHGCCKALRDQVAKMFHLDDGNERWTWKYEQAAGRDYEVRCRIEVTE